MPSEQAQTPPTALALRLLESSGKLASMGLRTLAREAVANINFTAETVQVCEIGKRLLAAVESMQSDMVDASAAVSHAEPLAAQIDDQQFREAWAALCAGNISKHDSIDSAAKITIHDRWFVPVEGMLAGRAVLATNQSIEPRQVQTGACVAAAKEVGVDTQSFAKPVIIAGAYSLTLLREVLRATSKPYLGYNPALYVVEPDVTQLARAVFATGLMRSEEAWKSIDIQDLARIRWCVGYNALQRLEQELTSKIIWQLPDRVLSVPGTSQEVSTKVVGVYEEAARIQRELNKSYADAIVAAYPVASQVAVEELWRSSTTKRAIIITSRYSSFVKHSAADLAEALNANGVDTSIFQEPDNNTIPSAVAYREAIVSHRPDVVISINYPRASLGDAIPANVPFVCWVQDSLSHLFDDKVGKSQGQFDYITGHLFYELFTKFSYPKSRAWASPVVASTGKFHQGEVASHDRARYMCDVAIVSHHSQTPDELHLKLVTQASAVDQRLVQAMHALRPMIEKIADECNTVPMAGALRAAVTQELARAGAGNASERAITTTLRGFALPMLDRTIRHRTVRDAVAICKHNNLKLHIYGNGWEHNNEFRGFSKGPLTHDGALRGAYQCAGMHIHVSTNNLLHQRVLECYLSGGLCISRYQRDALASSKSRVQYEMLRHEPDVVTPEYYGYFIDSSEIGRRLLHLANAVDVQFPLKDGRPIVTIAHQRVESMRAMLETLGDAPDFIDLSDTPGELVFSDRLTFERSILRAKNDPGWRANIVESTRSVVMNRFTHTQFAHRIIDELSANRGVTTHTGRRVAA